MAVARYRPAAGSVSTLRYHLVWCPKYRRPVLGGAVTEALVQLLHDKAAALDCTIEALEVMPDHVHLFVVAPPTLAPQQLANQFKGHTSRVLRERFPWLKRRLPSLWSRAYFVGSAGIVSASTIRLYIEQQKGVEPVRRAYVFRLYPNRVQEAALEATLDAHRQLYNRSLAERKAAWEAEGRTLTYGAQSATLKAQRLSNPSLARTNFSACQRTLKRLDRAFGAFFRRVKAGATPGYPRFKGRERFDTVEYTHRDGCRLFARGTPGGTSLYVQHIGRVKLKQHRPVEGTIKAVSLTRKADGWHGAVVCDLGEPVVAPSTAPAVGIDVGLISFLATSDGETVSSPRYSRQAQAALGRAQRAVARRERGSNRRRKAVARLRKHHLHVANQRRDFHHKTALALVRRYGAVCHEDLNVMGIARSKLAKSTLDAGWAQFLTILGHKAVEAGVRVEAVPPYNTSQECSACGSLPVVPKTLRDRVHVCPCGYTADRDVNAARNILRLGTGNRPGLGRQDTTRALALVS